MGIGTLGRFPGEIPIDFHVHGTSPEKEFTIKDKNLGPGVHRES